MFISWKQKLKSVFGGLIHDQVSHNVYCLCVYNVRVNMSIQMQVICEQQLPLTVLDSSDSECLSSSTEMLTFNLFIVPCIIICDSGNSDTENSVDSIQGMNTHSNVMSMISTELSNIAIQKDSDRDDDWEHLLNPYSKIESVIYRFQNVI